MNPPPPANSPSPINNAPANGVDLSACDREQVQFSGAIQPHGVMLVLRVPELFISHVSANTLALLGRPYAKLLNAPLSEALPLADAEYIVSRINSLHIGPVPVPLGPLALATGRFEVSVHRMDDNIILEIEQNSSDLVASAALYTHVRSCMAELHSAQGVDHILNVAVKRIRDLTSFDRVLAYKFLADGTGHILAEERRPDLASFLGLHFPPGDVPAPARRVLSLVWVRHQPDTGYTPVPLYSARPNSPPLDLSYSSLRSTSAMCNRYYQNLGVRSKVVVALLNNGEMWGAIICQHETPRSVSYEVRLACETIAHAVSALLHQSERSVHAEQGLQARQQIEVLIEKLTEDPFWPASLAQGLLNCIPATGAAALLDGGILLQGNTPSEPDVLELSHWLEDRFQTSHNPVFASHALSTLFPLAFSYRKVASGLLAVRVGPREYLLWFRPETTYEVSWAGDPQKPVEIDERDGTLRLAPRTSFDMRRSLLERLAEPWKTYEVEAVDVLARAVTALRRTDELTRSVADLKSVNNELESFTYTASHDLREPLRGISIYSQLLARRLATTTGPEEQQQLTNIQRLATRMDELLQSLLHYARLGKAAPRREIADLDELLAHARETVAHQLDAADASLIMATPLPRLKCDPDQVQQIFVNLIINGLKYNSSPKKRIEVGYHAAGPEPALYVRDNGIGIAPEYHDQVFKLFRRLHKAAEYGGGTGTGLAIVRKVVESHGGKIWIDSLPDQGTTFYFTLPLAEDAFPHGTQTTTA